MRTLWEKEPSRWETVFDQVDEIVQLARRVIESGDNVRLGPLMDADHALLQELTVSSPELDHLVKVARQGEPVRTLPFGPALVRTVGVISGDAPWGAAQASAPPRIEGCTAGTAPPMAWTR